MLNLPSPVNRVRPDLEPEELHCKKQATQIIKWNRPANVWKQLWPKRVKHNFVSYHLERLSQTLGGRFHLMTTALRGKRTILKTGTTPFTLVWHLQLSGWIFTEAPQHDHLGVTSHFLMSCLLAAAAKFNHSGPVLWNRFCRSDDEACIPRAYHDLATSLNDNLFCISDNKKCSPRAYQKCTFSLNDILLCISDSKTCGLRAASLSDNFT